MLHMLFDWHRALRLTEHYILSLMLRWAYLRSVPQPMPCSRAGSPCLLFAALQVAREALSELELPHLYRTVARGSPKRQELFEMRDHFQVPYLEVGTRFLCIRACRAVIFR